MKIRVAALIAAVGLSFLATFLLDPISQDQAYHNFADHRVWLGVPNFLDVVSNAPFLFVGIAGIVFLARAKLIAAKLEWLVFFVGVALVAFGSGYYHWAPSDGTLTWDRAPMTVAFMSLLAALVGESISLRAGRLVLWPAVLLGLASIVYWRVTGDLRLYGWVQFFPLLLAALLFLLFPGRIAGWRWLLVALGSYVLSKLLEAFDHQIFSLSGGMVAGHALKHLAAATACLSILEMLRRRFPQRRG